MKKIKTKENVKIETEQLIRLNKYLAESGVASRRKADELIEKGFVKVNRVVVTELGTKIKPDDKVTVSGNPVETNTKLIYFLLNKPKDFITTTDDEIGRKTVLDIVKTHSRIFPVGRLDRNTSGVLLLTNDGELTYRLTHPKYQIEKVYNVGLDKELKFPDAKKISLGVELEDGKTAPCDLFINPKDKKQITMTLREGKNHEVKRIFETLGYRVVKLERKEFAGLNNAGMKRGEYRKLSRIEILSLKKLTGLI
jgi:23S rRNA pseudouridine2605 synthase